MNAGWWWLIGWVLAALIFAYGWYLFTGPLREHEERRLEDLEDDERASPA